MKTCIFNKLKSQYVSNKGFSLLEIMLGVLVLGFILTALMGGTLFTVNTLNEARFRATAIDIASSCLEQFRQERNRGWVHFCDRNLNVSGAPRVFEIISCDGAVINGAPVRHPLSDNRSIYYIRVTSGGYTNCAFDRFLVRVQVNWIRFRDEDTISIGVDDFDNLNRTATVDQVFFRFADEMQVTW